MEGLMHTTELGAPAANGAETSPSRAQHLPHFMTLPGFEPTPPPLPPPSPALAPDEAGRGRGAQNLFRDSKQAPSGNRTWDLAMEGLLHTTELDRLYKPQALSPRLPPLPPPPSTTLPRPSPTVSADGEAEAKVPQFTLKHPNFMTLPGFEPAPPSTTPRGRRIYFAILNFKRLAGIKPGTLSWRASYIPLSWTSYTSLKPFPLVFRLCPPLPRLVTVSRN